MQCRGDSQQQTDHRTDQDGDSADPEGVGNGRGKHRADWGPVIQRGSFSEVSPEHIGHIASELYQDRIVQPHLRPLVGNLLRVHPFRRERIAGHDPDQHKQEEGNDQQRQQRHTDPFQRILEHIIQHSFFSG